MTNQLSEPAVNGYSKIRGIIWYKGFIFSCFSHGIYWLFHCWKIGAVVLTLLLVSYGSCICFHSLYTAQWKSTVRQARTAWSWCQRPSVCLCGSCCGLDWRTNTWCFNMSLDSYFCKTLDSLRVRRNHKRKREQAKLRLSVAPAAASMEANGNIGPTELFVLLEHIDDIILYFCGWTTWGHGRLRPREILWKVDPWLPAVKYQDGVDRNLTALTDPQYQKPVLIIKFHNSTGKQRVMEEARQRASLQPSQDDPAHKEPRVVEDTLQGSLTTTLNIYYPPAHLTKLLN